MWGFSACTQVGVCLARFIIFLLPPLTSVMGASKPLPHVDETLTTMDGNPTDMDGLLLKHQLSLLFLV